MEPTTPEMMARWMELALAEAEKAWALEEVPVGAVIVDREGNLLAAAHNRPISASDPSANAEIEALRRACARAGNYRLLNATLYVTIEPCVMCMGAIVHARVERVVFGAPDPRWGAAGSLYDLPGDRRLNHHPEIVGGVLPERCRDLMQRFFQARRAKPANN